MKTKLLIIPIILTLMVAGCETKLKQIPKRHIPTEKELAAFENKLTAIADELNIKGLSYAIVNESKIIKVNGRGLTEKNVKTDENTVYRIGNIADVFAATLILQLFEKEKIDIKNNVTDYLTSENKINKNSTIKNILSHDSKDNPGTGFIYDPEGFDVLPEVIQTCSGKHFPDFFRKNITRKLNMNSTLAEDNISLSKLCVSTVSDLSKYSMALDNNTLFENENTRDLMFRPVYLKNGEQTPSALGWFVQFYGDKKYVWAFGQGKGFSALFLKSVTDSLTLIVLANSESLNAPFRLQKGDVFNSPVASEFLKTFILRKDSMPPININEPDDNIQSALEKADNSPHRDLLVNEFISNIWICRYMNQAEKANHLIELYKQVLTFDVPWNLIEKEPRVAIMKAGDYINIKRPFRIDKDTTVNIFSVGEFVKEMDLNIWEYDAVEIYLDMQNSKNKSFDNTVDRQYRFNYDLPDVTGNFSTNENIKFVQSDPSKNSYLFEIGIPWKTLGSKKPGNGTRLGLDMNVVDNDGNGRKNFICWHFQKQQRAWEDPSSYGTIELCNKLPGNQNDSLCASIKVNEAVNIDGKIEVVWKTLPKYRLNRTTFEKFPDSKDLSTSFRSAWDEEYLYFLVEVTDDYKFKFPEGGDFGWIENEKSDTIWIMSPSNSLYAGGASTNRYINTTIPLKKGNYFLNFKTNQTNSYSHWTVSRPRISFYGIAVY